MNPLDISKRFSRAVRRYGFSGTLRYALWVVLSHPCWGGRWLRTAALNSFAFLFKVCRVDRVRVRNNGLSLYIDPRDYWSLRAFAFSASYDAREIAAVKQTVPRDYVFIDIGSNFGIWSFSLSDHFSRVISIEPDPRCYRCAVLSARALGLDHVTIVNVAFADREEGEMLFPARGHMGDSRVYPAAGRKQAAGIPIQALRFDTLMSRLVIDVQYLFIKLDVQGVEPLVLRGMEQALRRSKDVILWTELTEVTLASAGQSLNGYLELLQSFGFIPVNLFKGLVETSWEAVRQPRAAEKDGCFRLTTPQRCQVAA